ncbi:MAG TPA: flavin reductase family protein, partial [Tepidisphaeraceae bacterium]|nr:flavin reductase family protein [Tepidisphaeraceae bacterium]
EAPTASLLSAAFRPVPRPVAVVATATPEGPVGATVTAFVVSSLDPPMVAVSLEARSGTLAAIRERGEFTLSVLSSHGAVAADVFASRRPKHSRFAQVEYVLVGDLPLIREAVCNVACHCDGDYRIGDHHLLVGRVTLLRRGTHAALLRSGGRYVQAHDSQKCAHH